MSNLDLDLFREIMGNTDKYNSDGSTSFTPDNIASDMIDLLPDEIWTPEAKFLDINCKTGVFLVKIYNKLDKALAELPEFADDATRRDHILNNQLYGLAADEFESLFMSRRNVFGDPFAPHVEYVSGDKCDYITLVSKGYTDIIKTQLHRMMFDSDGSLSKEDLNKVKFDVVVGNPPYNNDIYLKFVTLGHELST